MWINLNGNVVNFDNYITVELRENKPLHSDQCYIAFNHQCYYRTL